MIEQSKNSTCKENILEHKQHKKMNKIHITELDWIGLCSVLRPLQHSIGYVGDGFYRSKDPTNSIEVLKEKRHELVG